MSFFTDPLRITLLIAGVIVIIAIYYYGRRPKLKKSSMAPENTATHPSEYQNLNEHDVNIDSVKVVSEARTLQTPLANQADHVGADVAVDEPVISKKETVSEMPADTSQISERFIILHIKAEENRPYHGSLLINTLEDSGLVFGEHNIYHFKNKRGGQRDVWFSVANMMEPGIFDLDNIQDFQTKGLSLFMRLPVSGGNGIPAFTQMMSCAQRLIKKLGGQLLDEEHEPLTVTAITELHKTVESYDKQLSLI